MGHNSVDIVKTIPTSTDDHVDLATANEIRRQLGDLLRGYELGMVGPILGEFLLSVALEFSDGDLTEARELMNLTITRAVDDHKATLES